MSNEIEEFNHTQLNTINLLQIIELTSIFHCP